MNFTGGKKQTALGILQRLKWGWDAPSDVAVGEYKKDMTDLTTDAVREIEKRKVQDSFPTESV